MSMPTISESKACTKHNKGRCALTCLGALNGVSLRATVRGSTAANTRLLDTGQWAVEASATRSGQTSSLDRLGWQASFYSPAVVALWHCSAQLSEHLEAKQSDSTHICLRDARDTEGDCDTRVSEHSGRTRLQWAFQIRLTLKISSTSFQCQEQSQRRIVQLAQMMSLSCSSVLVRGLPRSKPCIHGATRLPAAQNLRCRVRMRSSSQGEACLLSTEAASETFYRP